MRYILVGTVVSERFTMMMMKAISFLYVTHGYIEGQLGIQRKAVG
jgi:hypothetical protein